MRFVFLVSLVFGSVMQSVHAQSSPKNAREVNNSRMTLVLVASGISYTGAMVALSKAWYSKSEQTQFHFFDDSGEWKQMDKAGHIFSAFQLASGGSRILQWTRLNEKKSDRIAAISGFAMMTSIEVLDGFSSAYGASVSDMSANALGTGLYFGQKILWNELRLYPKFSVHQTSFAAMRPSVLGSTIAQQILKDYNGQTQWISVDMDKFLKFTRWINVAVGYGIGGMAYANDAENIALGLSPHRQFYIAIDPDLSSIKSRHKWINSIIYFLNMVKLPAPALRFEKDKVRGYYLYF